MKPEDTKVLVLDIDGTLTNSKKQITDNTKKSIIHIMEEGHIVMLASGRPTPGMRRYAKELELEKYGGYLLSFNGGKIINCKTGDIIFQKTLPPVILPGLYKFAKENDCGLMTYLADTVILGTRRDEYVELEARINGMPIKDVPNFLSFVDFDMNKCLMTAPIEKAPGFEDKLNELYGNIVSVYRSEPFFIEIMPKGVDKASSLERMLSAVGIKRENAVCCGDGFNDMTMIRYAGVGVAMANAQEKVKKAADYITTSNDEDGIVNVIEKFILNKS